MAKRIGQLHASVTADSAQFSAEMAKVRTETEGVVVTMEKVPRAARAKAAGLRELSKEINNNTAGLRGMQSAMSNTLGLVTRTTGMIGLAAGTATAAVLAFQKLAASMENIDKHVQLARRSFGDLLSRELKDLRDAPLRFLDVDALAEGVKRIDEIDEGLQKLRESPPFLWSKILQSPSDRQAVVERQINDLMEERGRLLTRHSELVQRARNATEAARIEEFRRNQAIDQIEDRFAAEDAHRAMRMNAEGEIAQMQWAADDARFQRLDSLWDQMASKARDLDQEQMTAAERITADFDERMLNLERLKEIAGSDDAKQTLEQWRQTIADAMERGLGKLANDLDAKIQRAAREVTDAMRRVADSQERDIRAMHSSVRHNTRTQYRGGGR